MEEPVRLACPQCELVYRLKRYTPGKAYTCKNCGGPLTLADNLSAAGGDEAAAAPRLFAPPPLFDNSGDLAVGRSGIASGLAPESGLSRLPKLIEELTHRLDVLKDLELSEGETGPAAKLLDLNEKLEDELHAFREDVDNRLGEFAGKVTEDLQSGRREVEELRGGVSDLDARVAKAIDEKMREIRDELSGRLGDLGRSVDGVAEKAAGQNDLTPELEALKQELRQQGETVTARLAEHLTQQKRELEAHHATQKQELDAHREMQKEAINSLLAPVDAAAPASTVEVDIDELADRLVAGLRGSHSKFMDPESGLAMDAMARLADELVKEQSANTAKLDKLTEEVKTAAAGLTKLEEWRGDLPERVADEIGQTVEARVVGPISGALAKQAPSILSDLQDNKLVDIVSRSVREAQRPLLREILSGTRGGIPLWLFASVLLPLLLILGYLFLPGEVVGHRASDASVEHVSESLARIESGMHSSADNEDRLRTIEEAVLDIHAEALAHVRNAASLEAENRNLKAMLAERDQLMNEYKETLQTQVKRLREYETRLVQLGVSPKAIGE